MNKKFKYHVTSIRWTDAFGRRQHLAVDEYTSDIKAYKKHIMCDMGVEDILLTYDTEEVAEWIRAEKPFKMYPDGTKARGCKGEIWVKSSGGWVNESTGDVDRYLHVNWTGEIMIPSNLREKTK